jgi:hypothetical protein
MSGVLGPDVAARYAAWLAQGAEKAGHDAYYTEPRARFVVEDGDVLVTPADVVTTKASCGVGVVSERASARVEVCGVRPDEAARVFAAIDGTRTAAEVRREAAVDEETWATMTAALFGTVVFAPLAVASLEERLPNAEIVRYPGSPYEVVRAYWANMADVSEHIEARLATAEDDFATFLRELHALALAGKSGESFYRPASPIAAKERLSPGQFADLPPVTERSSAGIRFVSGLRVNASALGGPYFRELLLESIPGAGKSDPAPPWGEVIVARADADSAAAPWFCPPRPLTPAHFDVLRALLSAATTAAKRGDRALALSSAGAFHWHFVRLHPFGFANQCLAMSLANHVVRAVVGAGMPHLVLDHLALDLPLDVYREVFGRGVRHWVPVAGVDAVQRTLSLMQKKQRSFAFIGALSQAPSVEAARAILGADPDGARLSLL